MFIGFSIKVGGNRHPLFEVPYPQLKRGQQSLGALVAVVRLFRYINYHASSGIRTRVFE